LHTRPAIHRSKFVAFPLAFSLRADEEEVERGERKVAANGALPLASVLLVA
jgi:hypothetical protein